MSIVNWEKGRTKVGGEVRSGHHTVARVRPASGGGNRGRMDCHRADAAGDGPPTACACPAMG
jgi:hypothetical protein